MEKILKIIDNQNERSSWNWKVVLGDKGNWGYTTSEKLNIGDFVVFEIKNDEFFSYVSLEGTKKLNN